MKSVKIHLTILFCMIQLSCANSEEFKVKSEVTGPYQTNCYLIYGAKSKEAALIDPGWKVDTLVEFIKDNKLDLKYILITHGHADHYYYVAELKKQFPKVKWGVHKEDFDRIILCPDWPLKAYGKVWMENARKNSDENVYLDFDTKSIGVPDFSVQRLSLSSHAIFFLLCNCRPRRREVKQYPECIPPSITNLCYVQHTIQLSLQVVLLSI